MALKVIIFAVFFGNVLLGIEQKKIVDLKNYLTRSLIGEDHLEIYKYQELKKEFKKLLQKSFNNSQGETDKLNETKIKYLEALNKASARLSFSMRNFDEAKNYIENILSTSDFSKLTSIARVYMSLKKIHSNNWGWYLEDNLENVHFNKIRRYCKQHCSLDMALDYLESLKVKKNKPTGIMQDLMGLI